MASKRETVIEAVVEFLKAAKPYAEVVRKDTKSVTLTAGGYINVLDGSPELTGHLLSPLTYEYDHVIPAEVTLPPGVDVDGFLLDIGVALEADRTLGGLVDWLDVAAPEPDDEAIYGAEPLQAVPLEITASYSTSNPLG